MNVSRERAIPPRRVRVLGVPRFRRFKAQSSFSLLLKMLPLIVITSLYKYERNDLSARKIISSPEFCQSRATRRSEVLVLSPRDNYATVKARFLYRDYIRSYSDYYRLPRVRKLMANNSKLTVIYSVLMRRTSRNAFNNGEPAVLFIRTRFHWRNGIVSIARVDIVSISSCQMRREIYRLVQTRPEASLVKIRENSSGEH